LNKGVRFYEFGGPEVLRYEDVTLDALAPDEVRVRHVAIGLNFIDIYQRSGAISAKLNYIEWAASLPSPTKVIFLRDYVRYRTERLALMSYSRN
jgi:NADPH:quinone reductase-like Zn-dependent oxidoreductase